PPAFVNGRWRLGWGRSRGWRTHRPRTAGRRPPWRSRAGCRLTGGFRQTRLAQALLDARPLPVTRQGASRRRASPPPHSDDLSGDAADRTSCPNQFEWREQPPALVAPENAARDQLTCHCRGVEALTAKTARDPKSFAQLADLRHAVRGLPDRAAPDI